MHKFMSDSRFHQVGSQPNIHSYIRSQIWQRPSSPYRSFIQILIFIIKNNRDIPAFYRRIESQIINFPIPTFFGINTDIFNRIRYSIRIGIDLNLNYFVVLYLKMFGIKRVLFKLTGFGKSNRGKKE
ncbi:MAG: hypothetical protein ACD_78C00456G0002 [uncultured bacterium (gcode 4)]|uniref:Uncharacterized protein n=1 Tax=uncultured bacterium (gcode 4) TaxID=1234023 RepID=K1YVK8_9BACT|nr:MAG: hypothetical protein ACD_78C00456G0002 [uncultured bacterium (gcode 4)]